MDHLRETRRDFLRLAAGVGAGLAMASNGSPAAAQQTQPAPATGAGSVAGLKHPPLQAVRMGFIGVGGRGTSLLDLLLKIEGVSVNAVCDIKPGQVANAQRLCTGAGRPKPEGYGANPTDYKRLCDRNDLDLILIATPWEWHVPMAVDSMLAGKHAVVEVPAAVTLEECWQLVDTAEKTRRHCMMLENCCYGEAELMVLNMARQGLFGELLHGEAAYIHDLRGLLFSGSGEGEWRTQHSIKRNGNLYPTHGLGPVAQYMGINRGDRFDFLVSVSGPSRGMQIFAEKHFPADAPQRKWNFIQGDMNTSIIRTVNGRTIMVQHDTTSPRPYSRINLLQGTAGTFYGYPDRIHIEGRSPGDQWESIDKYRSEFMHPLWKRVGEEAKKNGGHGGMDFVQLWRLIYCLRNGLPLDMDVYDAASWSAVGPLSEISVANRGRSVDIPDFTRGNWKSTPPLGVVS